MSSKGGIENCRVAVPAEICCGALKAAQLLLQMISKPYDGSFGFILI